jgi:hypothetical protein
MIFSTVPARVALGFSVMACPLVFQSDLPLVRRFLIPRSAICPEHFFSSGVRVPRGKRALRLDA